MQSPNITIDLYNTQINVIVFFLAAGFLNFQKSATKFCRSHQLIWFGTGLLKFSHSVCQNQTPWKFLLIKCGSLEQKLHLFCPSKKKGASKILAHALVLLLSAVPQKSLRLRPHRSGSFCGHLYYPPTSALVTSLHYSTWQRPTCNASRPR